MPNPMRWMTLFALMTAGGAAAGELPPLPRAVAGQFVGTLGDWLLAAGGTWWTAPPAQGGRKVWTDRILVLEPGARSWREAGKLPVGLGYGGAVSLDGRMLVLGGQTETAVVKSAWRLVRKGREVAAEALPDLPAPAAFLGAAETGGRVYVFGGQRAGDASEASATLWSMDAASLAQWRAEPDLPGAGRILPAAAGCADGFYIASGAALSPAAGGPAKRRYLRDAWRFDPRGGWRRIEDVPAAVVAAPAICVGSPVVFGGDDGSMAGRVFTPPAAHPGFRKSILRFDGAKWSEAGTLPAGLVTTGAARWQGSVAIVGGEDRPGSRSATVLAVDVGVRR